MLPRTDSHGYFYSTGAGRPVQIMVFAPDGRLSGGFGTPGTGPALVSTVLDIVPAAGDSIFVFDTEGVHVFSPQHEHAREMSLEVRPPLARVEWSGLHTNNDDLNRHAVLADGRMLRAGTGRDFRILSPDGSVTPAITVDTTRARGCYWCGRWSFVFAPGDRLYAAVDESYVVEERGLDGTLLRRFVRDAKWFPPRKPLAGKEANTDEAGLAEISRPKLVGIRRTPDGLIWTHSYVMDPANPVPMSVVDAFTQVAERGSIGGIPRDIQNQVQAHFHTYVEVFDPERNELLATRVYPFLLIPMTGDLAAQPIRRGPEFSSWKIHRLRLMRS
jgi:hypothetical protein